DPRGGDRARKADGGERAVHARPLAQVLDQLAELVGQRLAATTDGRRALRSSITRSQIRSASARLLVSGTGVSARSSISTAALSSPPNPAPAAVTSLATSRSTRLSFRFARACSSTRSVS